MRTSLKRTAAIAGTLIVAASAALIGAQGAQADGNYYGAWTLEGWNFGGKRIDCPGSLPLPPPAPTISCKAGEVLELKTNYRFKSTFKFAGDNSAGGFDVIKIKGSKYKTIVFDPDTATNDPRAYQLKLQGTGSGAPKKMVIFLGYVGPNGNEKTVKMIFRRDAN